MKSNQIDSTTQARVVVHAELCKGCGRCVVSCNNQVLAMTNRLNHMGYAVADVAIPEKCTSCGLCFYSCPEPGAISVNRDESGSTDAT